MKKRILTLCGVGIASIALASCGGNKEITYEEESISIPAEKGNKIDSIDKTYYRTTWSTYFLSLDSTMDFFEVFRKLYNFDSFRTNGTNNNYQYKYIEKNIKNYTSSNTFNFTHELGFVFTDKENVNNVDYSCIDSYYEKNNDNGILKINNYYSILNYNKSISSNDFENSNNVSKNITQTAGFYESSVQNDVTTEKIKKASKLSSETGGQQKDYYNNNSINTSTNKKYYIEASEKSTDSNYGYQYVGISDKTGEIYYSISEEIVGQPTYQSASIYKMYDFDLGDLYETSYELTDKYIILKTKCNYTEEIDDIANGKVFNVSKDQLLVEKKKEILKLIENDYKGSSTEYEIWISYTGDFLYFDYYKESCNTVYNIDKTYEKSDFTSVLLYQTYSVYNRAYPYSYEDYVGKKVVKKGNSSTYKEISAVENDYDKKMNDLYAECEKDNAYKDLVFKPYNPNLF